MNIAFYAPLKSPDHPVPSGDRLMARLIQRALRMAGHTVQLASEFRSFAGAPETVLSDRMAQAAQEIERISAAWNRAGTPDLFFCYHPYYKAPDLLGPVLSSRFDLPYMTAESSYSHRRNIGYWREAQALVAEGAQRACVNICLTERDALGLREAVPDARVARIKPFIDTASFKSLEQKPSPGHLVTIAMMRGGDKLSSYAALAKSLTLIKHLPWRLSIAGDGPARNEVEALFSQLPKDRITWLGEQTPDEIRHLLATGWLYLWPGHGEAYGLAYLEAQAAGVPVVAEAVAGVPEVVLDGKSGLLSPAGDMTVYGNSIAMLLSDVETRHRLARSARQFALQERSIEAAATTLDQIIRAHVGSIP